MGFLKTVESARGFLERNGRISIRGLKREFGLDDEGVEELVEELVDIQQVAAREANAIAWIGGARVEANSAPPSPVDALEKVASDPAEEIGGGGTQAVAPENIAPVTAEPAAAEGERRQLTVLFCDLVDSTRLAAGFDPEDWREVIRAYQSACVAEIQRFAGHVAQYLGDGLLVYFGYPQAHEDDAIRGVSAGIAIVDQLPQMNARIQALIASMGQEVLQVRVGVHTGPVVVGAVGGGEQIEQLALGETVNLASRLLGTCEPNGVVISEVTRRLVRGVFVFEELGQKSLKGVPEPVAVHRVLRRTGVRSRLDVAAASGLTPLVGREQEIALMLDRWELVTEGHGQVVLIDGEAGMGKSRLVQAMREELAEERKSWLEVSCSPYHESHPLYPIIELLEQALLLGPGESADDRIAKLEAALSRVGFVLPKIFPLFAELLSVPQPKRYPRLALSPDTQRRMTLEALTTWLFAVTKEQPMILLVEDLQWIDPSTLELLGMLVEEAPTAPLLFLATFRPGFRPPWTSRSHMVQLTLNPLSRRQVRRMLEGVTGGKTLPGEVVEEIVEKTDGVPLFVEELTKMVLESDLLKARGDSYELAGPLPPLAIPTTLQDSLMARLDRLGPTKEVVQVGSVLGREFSYRMLEAISSSDPETLATALDRLESAELLYRRGTPPEASYTFKHTMIQETAYQSLLKSSRQHFHARVAEALEHLFPEDVQSSPEIIAWHYDEAGLAEPAIRHYQQAAERSGARSANQEVIVQTRRALELLATLPETPERNQRELDLQMAIGMAQSGARGWADPECEGAFARARDLTSQLGDVPELPRVLVALATSYYAKGEIAASAELARQALVLAERAGAIYLISAHYGVGAPLLYQGEFAESLRHLEHAIALYDPAEHAAFAHLFGSDRGVTSRSYAAFIHLFLGQHDPALANSRESVALAKRVEHPYSLAPALAFAGIFYFACRDPEQVREYADQTIALCERLDFPLYLGIGTTLRGWGRAMLGETAEGVAEMQQGLAALARTGTGVGAPIFLAMLAEATWKAGRHDDALGALQLGIARAEATGQHFWDAELFRLQALILLGKDADRGEQAEGLLHRALEIARRQGARLLELRSATALARLLHARGQRAQAHELLAPLVDALTGGLHLGDLEEARALIDET